MIINRAIHQMFGFIYESGATWETDRRWKRMRGISDAKKSMTNNTTHPPTTDDL